MLLAADIGGTKSLFGLFEQVGSQPVLRYKKQYASGDFSSFESALETFFSEVPPTLEVSIIQAACFSLAGPIIDGQGNFTNLKWQVNQKNLELSFPCISKIVLANDLVAVAQGIELLPEKDFLSLTPQPLDLGQGSPPSNKNTTKAVIAPGTGLGEALLIKGQAHPSEGGHCDFAPRSPEEIRLWQFLQQKYGHVSYERILSGPGLVNLLQFLVSEREENLQHYDLIPEEITKKALQKQCPLCQRALNLFISILGAEAGNLALKTMATGGIYLGGGIVPQILPKLQEGTFIAAFQDKGRFRAFMETIPVYVILNKEAALYGAAQIALQYFLKPFALASFLFHPES